MTELSKQPVYRVGGSVHYGFFVPPYTANYTFSTATHGQMELSLSYDGTPAASQVILKADAPSSSLASLGSGRRTTAEGKPIGPERFTNNHLRNLDSAKTWLRSDDPHSAYTAETQHSQTLTLRGGKPYYFHLQHSSNEGASMKLLSLTITNFTDSFSTSFSLDSFGTSLSGEFFREVRNCEERSDEHYVHSKLTRRFAPRYANALRYAHRRSLTPTKPGPQVPLPTMPRTPSTITLTRSAPLPKSSSLSTTSFTRATLMLKTPTFPRPSPVPPTRTLAPSLTSGLRPR